MKGATTERRHRMPFGADVGPEETRFRLWAPVARTVDLVLGSGEDKRSLPMTHGSDGWYQLRTPAPPGTRYGFRIDGGILVPDPASRFQPIDVHGPSEVIDPGAWVWTDTAWTGRPWEETVLYELHVGTFTREGSYAGVESRLDTLVDLGVTAIELMPLAATPGGRNWGYDGVAQFAPSARYGRPEDLKALVEAAHRRGLMVFLDVVYNHFGPEGNYLYCSAPPFFSEKHHTPWGAALNFDDENSRVVREFFIHNALYWIEEYHLDGLRLDAVNTILDDGTPHILDDIAAAVRAAVPAGRSVHLVLESDANDTSRLERHKDGRPRHYIAQWNDDLHHALHVLATGERGGYYGDYVDRPIHHLGRALAEGFAWQGEPSPFRDHRPRGEPSASLPPTAFVSFLQNHDQVGNRAFGERLHHLVAASVVRALAAVVLLAPAPPMLFMGEEWAASTPFLFFCDLEQRLRDPVRKGRRREFARFPEFRTSAARQRLPDPLSKRTFTQSILEWEERDTGDHREHLDHYRALLALRRTEIVPRLVGTGGHAGRFSVIGAHLVTVDWRLGDGSILHLTANLGATAAPGLALVLPGRRLYATPGVAPVTDEIDGVIDALPPWSVVWSLEPGPAGGRPAHG